VGDRVALHQGGTMVTNGMAVITAKSAATPSITVTFDGAADSADNDLIVFANGVTDTTLAGGSDYNKWPVGLLDITTSTSVHGLSGSTYSAWNAARNSTAGGRYGAAMLKADKQAVQNASDGSVTDVIMAQGVENDVEAGERAARIYQSSAMDLDQSVKAKGVQFHTSPLVPPGHVFAYDRSGWGKKILTEKPSEDGSLDWSELFKAEDRSGWKGGFDFIYAIVCRNRGKFVRRAALTEQ
jgi:hypothetical protein